MEKAKILFVGPVPPEVGGTSYGGIATHLWQLATHLKNRGFAVYILTNVRSPFEYNGVHLIAWPNLSKLHKAFTAIKSWWNLPKHPNTILQDMLLKERLAILYNSHVLEEVINDVQPDIIHVHSFHNIATLAFGLLKNYPPLVVTDHGFWQGIHNNSDEIRVKKTARLARRIICVSNFSRDRVIQFGLASEDKTTVIYNPIDPKRIPLLNKEQLKKELGYIGKRVIFFSGVVEPVKRKGLDKLLGCFINNREIKERFALIILTDNKTAEFVRSICAHEQLEALILGPQQWENIVKLYNLADVFVMPSKSESFGLVYVEAMLAGTPVVGFQPIIEELSDFLGTYIGEGFDAEKEDETALSKKIELVMSRNVNRELLRQQVMDKLSWDALLPRFELLYQELLMSK